MLTFIWRATALHECKSQSRIEMRSGSISVYRDTTLGHSDYSKCSKINVTVCRNL